MISVTDICSYIDAYHYRISSINTAFSISTPVRYYLNTNNIDIVVIFTSSAPLNSTVFATPGTSHHFMGESEIFKPGVHWLKAGVCEVNYFCVDVCVCMCVCVCLCVCVCVFACISPKAINNWCDISSYD